MFPNSYLNNSLKKIENQFSMEMERRIRMGDNDHRHRFVSMNDSYEDFLKLNEITRESEERTSNILFSKKFYSQEVIEYEEFISGFRTNHHKLSKDVYSAFSSVNGVNLLVNFMASNLFTLMKVFDESDASRYSLSFMKKNWDMQLEYELEGFEYEIEKQRDYLVLCGFDESILDKFPTKKFVHDYIDLIEAKLLLDILRREIDE